MKKTSIEFWGRAAWDTLHIFTFAYPINPCEQDKKNGYQFMISFANMIPCAKCRKHWYDIVRSGIDSPTSDVLASRTNLSSFVVDGHNKVNARLGKRKVTFEQALQMYSAEFHPSQTIWTSNRFQALFFIFFVIISLSLVFVFTKSSRTTKKKRV